jgi:VWA domain-containing protein
MRRRRSAAVDTHDVGALQDVARRTRLVRLILAVAAVAALSATVSSARSLDVQKRTIVPTGSAPVVVVDLSLSIGEGSYGDVRRSLANVIESDRPVGLVVFSDVPYELLPPGTPSAELRPVLRRLIPPRRGKLATPWTQTFRLGTKISDALVLAGRMLERERVKRGSIVLVSDLQTAPDDVAALTRTIEDLRSRSVDIRIVPIGALSDGRLLFGRLLGETAFAAPAQYEGEVQPLRTDDSAPLPVGLLILTGVFFVALAVHERFAAQLALLGRTTEAA